jgi:hypothetical protein
MFGLGNLTIESGHDMCLNECLGLQICMFHLVCFEMSFYYVQLF